MRRAGLLLLSAAALLLSAASGPPAANAAAEVLFSQAVGAADVAVPSQSTPTFGQTFVADDFVVPAGTHWRLGAVQAYGTTEVDQEKRFDVTISRDFGGGFPGETLFSEKASAAGGPDYLVPLEGVPKLEPGVYWIQVQAQTAGGGDSWAWLTGPDTPGTHPAVRLGEGTSPAGAEPGQAFELMGTAMQTITTSAEGYATVLSEPAGIDCTTICVSEFPRGTKLKLTASQVTPATEFTEWQWRRINPETGSAPCVTENPCTFALDHDLTVLAKSSYVDKVTILRVVRDRRTGRGRLLVWLPGEGVVQMSSSGVRSFPASGPLPAGLVRIPLVPRARVAARLRCTGHATVGVAITFRPTKSTNRGAVPYHLTLVREGSTKPAHRIP